MKVDNLFHEETLSGRISASPSMLLHEEILKPQFDYELKHLLPYYIQIEEVMTIEYERLGLISKESMVEIVNLLNQLTKENITADPKSNMSDICFAIEQYVESRLEHPVPNWHVDRSRNDVQATAQIMFARENLVTIMEEITELIEEVLTLSNDNMSVPMPGYTHYQSAQIITVGFYFTAVSEVLQKSLNRMIKIYDEINKCPLGSGAMSGMELEWNRAEMATKLGFLDSSHALVSVASKEWMLQIAAECSNLATVISRFITDLITWGSSEYKFFVLPDEMSGISSAMPQKKNYPILERIRGRSVHINSYYYDMLNAQRNTPFTNLVETAKEGGSNFYPMITCMKSVLKLYTAVIKAMKFNKEHMYEMCANDFFGGFSLANLLTLQCSIPYRQSQIISGKYIVAMNAQNRKPNEVELSFLNELCEKYGYKSSLTEDQLIEIFSVTESLSRKKTQGSTNPLEIKQLIDQQKSILREQKKQITDLIRK
ncbi:argininosuccinate lyase [Metabacillus halosaccharovorans]|uniref:argininosuccinate lyase n=1 Tax=Metabacillus halosaccharovorans TaxID=930124 RepID=UPI0037355560